nr:zf-HC2 domain-containing protein [Micromonospora sp. DSM 115978]
ARVCVDVVELGTAYLDAGLPDELRARVDAHRASCRGCAAYLDQIRRTVATTGQIGAAEVPPELGDRLLAAYRAWHTS